MSGDFRENKFRENHFRETNSEKQNARNNIREANSEKTKCENDKIREMQKPRNRSAYINLRNAGTNLIMQNIL